MDSPQYRHAQLLARDLVARGIGSGSILKYLWRAYGATLSNADIARIVGEALWFARSTSTLKGA